MATYPERRGEIWKQTTEHRTAIYEPESDGLHLLNPSAFAIWELCDGRTTPEQMAEAISELTGLAVEVAAQDVTSTLETLSELDLVSL